MCKKYNVAQLNSTYFANKNFSIAYITFMFTAAILEWEIFKIG